ncbi:MAG: hypothetical protein ACE5GV_06495 [Candidatus Scalindua sp.]
MPLSVCLSVCPSGRRGQAGNFPNFPGQKAPRARRRREKQRLKAKDKIHRTRLTNWRTGKTQRKEKKINLATPAARAGSGRGGDGKITSDFTGQAQKLMARSNTKLPRHI